MAKVKPTWDGDKTAVENARLALPALAEHFFRSGREVANSKLSNKALHQFRLEVKRFRYSLELFRPCYGPGLKQRLDRLKKIQDHLGALNDCQTTMAMLQEPSVRKMPERKPLQELLEKRVAEHRNAFVKYWKETFDEPKQQRWWTNYLKRFAR